MHVYKRYDSQKRWLAGPVLFFNLKDELAQLKEDPEWHERHRNAVTLVKEPHLSVVLVALQKGGRLEPHKTQGPFTLQVIGGAVRVRLDKETRMVKTGELMSIEPAIAHEVEALDESAVLLTIAEPKIGHAP